MSTATTSDVFLAPESIPAPAAVDSRPSRRLLRVYLDDHLAGSALGLSLARSASTRETKGPMARFLRELVADLENDQNALRALMKDLDFTENRAKNALGWLGAQAIRFKPNGRLLGRSPLSRVLDLEALIAGSRARSSLFQTLASVATPDQRETYALSQRAERALLHIRALDGYRQRAAEEALLASR